MTGDSEEHDTTWGVVNWKRYAEAPEWPVPWGWGTVLFGMAAWGVSFLIVGVLSVPLTMQLFHFPSIESLTSLQQSEIALCDQLLATFVGIGIVWAIGERAGEERPPDYLRASLEHPFRKPDGWLLWAIVGVACAPCAIAISAALADVLPTDGGRGTVDGVAQMMSPTMDDAVFTNLLIVTGVLAPVLEETVFRGFLLTSLTKHMAAPTAVLTSSAAFAACHLSARDFPQLMALGVVMGFMYLRSRNLLTSIVIHGTWNSGVLLLLYTLVNSGMSVDDILGLSN